MASERFPFCMSSDVPARGTGIQPRGGALNFRLRAMCHQKDPTFSLALTERPLFLPTFTK